jgi:transcriptional regulator with XRE-family HTH domain
MAERGGDRLTGKALRVDSCASASDVLTSDAHIGQRLRGMRIVRGLSQAAVAGEVGLSFQQIQKYESGQSRVTAAKLIELAKVLGVPVGVFFEGISRDEQTANSANPAVLSQEAWELAAEFDRIGSPETKKKVLDLVRCLVSDQG